MENVIFPEMHKYKVSCHWMHVAKWESECIMLWFIILSELNTLYGKYGDILGLFLMLWVFSGSYCQKGLWWKGNTTAFCSVLLTSDKLFCHVYFLSMTQNIEHHVCHVARLEHFVINVSRCCFIFLKSKTCADLAMFSCKTVPIWIWLVSPQLSVSNSSGSNRGNVCMLLKQSVLFIQSPWTSRIRKFVQWILIC